MDDPAGSTQHGKRSEWAEYVEGLLERYTERELYATAGVPRDQIALWLAGEPATKDAIERMALRFQWVAAERLRALRAAGY